MENLIQLIPFDENIKLFGAFNGHIGVEYSGFEFVHGRYGFGQKNEV